MDQQEYSEWIGELQKEKSAAFRLLRHLLRELLHEKMQTREARVKFFTTRLGISRSRLRDIMDPVRRTPTWTATELGTIICLLDLPQDEQMFLHTLAAQSHGWRVPLCPIPSSLTRIVPNADSLNSDSRRRATSASSILP